MKVGSNQVRWAQLDKEQGTRLLFSKARIDNRGQLVGALGLSDDSADEAILLALYKRHSVKCADYLIGDFAFAIWDADLGRVYAARDIMGCQPVYYSTNTDGFFIAEQLEQVLAIESVSEREDELFIAAKLFRAFAHFERTSFAEVRKIPPAHYILAGPAGTERVRYWRPEQVAEGSWESHEDCLSEFRDLLKRAIADRLPLHGTVGVHVSGGLDCSAIAVLVAEMLAERGRSPPLAFTWYPEPNSEQTDAENEEYERLAAVCAKMRVDPIYTEPTVDTVLDVLDRDDRVRPICNASYNEHCVLQLACEAGVTTIFSGWGGDEAASFDGRGYLEELALEGRWRSLRKFARAQGQGWLRFALAMLANGLALRFVSDDQLRRLQQDRARPDISALRAYLRLLMPTKPKMSDDRQDAAERKSYLSPDASDRVCALDRMAVVRTPNTRSARCNLLRYPGLITRIESIALDAARFKVRHVYPMMDRRVVEFALSLPSHVFRDERRKRLFYRQAMDSVLPAEVCWRHVKDDPARVNHLLKSLKGAFTIIGQRYTDRRRLPARANFVDLERLIADLEPEKVAKRSRWGRLFSAVEFLGAANTHDRF